MDTWEQCKPASFIPYFQKERNMEEKLYFPIMYHWDRIQGITHCPYATLLHVVNSSDWVAVFSYWADVAGNLRSTKYHSARRSRTAKSTTSITSIPSPKNAINDKKTVLSHARELYGVAFASSDFAPARVTSCNSLPLFGPWFTDYNEQAILINLLKDVEV